MSGRLSYSIAATWLLAQMEWPSRPVASTAGGERRGRTGGVDREPRVCIQDSTMIPTAKTLARRIQQEQSPSDRLELIYETVAKVTSDPSATRDDIVVILNAVLTALRRFFILMSRPPGEPESAIRKLINLGVTFAAKEITKEVIKKFGELYIANPLPRWYITEQRRAAKAATAKQSVKKETPRAKAATAKHGAKKIGAVKNRSTKTGLGPARRAK